MRRLARQDQGVALILLLFVLLIVTVLGVWALNSSRFSVLKAGNKQATASLELFAEEALQKSVRRFQEIINFEGNLTDTVATANNGAARTIPSLLAAAPTGLCMPLTENDTTCRSLDCVDGVSYDFDAVLDSSKNVICNFLGNASKRAQVIVVRKTDHIISADERNGIFLINVIAKDSNDRRQVLQGVVVVPYNPNTGLPLEQPYLATTSKVSG